MAKLKTFNRHNLLVIAIIFFGCSETKDGYNNCKSNSVSMLKFTIDIGLRETIIENINSEDSAFVKDLIEILDDLGHLYSDYEERAGGFDPNTWLLVDGCQIDNRSRELFDSSHLPNMESNLHVIRAMYTEKVKQDLIDVILLVVHNDLGKGSLFYSNLNDTSLADIMMHLLVIQNKLYVIVIEEYLVTNMWSCSR